MTTAGKVASNTTQSKNLWYKQTGWIITLLILLWPLGLYLMWKYTDWNRVIKWVVTGLLSIATLASLVATMDPSPTLSIDNIGDGRISTDDTKYTVTGSTGSVSDGVKVTINGKEAMWSGDKFTAIVDLTEGDNQIVVRAIKGGQVDEEKFIIHRNTAAEIKAKKDAEAAAEAKNKAEAKAEAAAEAAREAEARAEAARANAPAEYKSALNQADTYANQMNLSKKGLYDQLVSEYGGQFSAKAAQYAIDNVVADWKANALAQAKDYQDNMSMSPAAIRDQLISPYGGQFTDAEADYAIQHLND